MSRYCGEKNSQPILAAAEDWRKQGLESNGSVFSQDALWTIENLEALDRYYVRNPDEGGRTFLEKLNDQLAPAPAQAKKLAAEMLWVMFLCPSSVTPEKKREIIHLVWSWSGQELPRELALLSSKVLDGIGSAGTAFNTNRWRELVFFIKLMLSFKQLASAERGRLLADGWAFAEWLKTIPEEDSRQFRHMILYLLFPDTFERIFGGTDRREIVGRFTGRSPQETENLSTTDIDHELARIRREQEEKYGTSEIDFYVPPVLALWKTRGFDYFTKDIKRDHVLKALNDIDTNGIPADAKSTTYDLIQGQRRYPPKLVLSLASKYATGEEFDRSLFSGGESSPAFALLRKLGFQIERKDFVETLIERFLKQAEAADDLSTKAYPKRYRGLQVHVSFGQGNFGRIPWISFLGDGQKTSFGIYPLFLFYREIGLLILAHGISETNAPPRAWSDTATAITIREFLMSKVGKKPERYGDSLVYASYQVPADIDGKRITADLDALIAKYEDELAIQGPRVATITDETSDRSDEESATAAPYTIDDALTGLFIDRDKFKGILELWERKKNVILHGPPGVGKTYFCRRLAFALMHEEAKDRIELVQFHQTYAYEDFVQGYRPNGTGFELRNGKFYQFCERARDDDGHNYVFIVDEINRGNLSKIFGELLMLVESDKRSKQWAVPLAYALDPDDRFYIPPNLYLVGLMNTADRSLAMVDYALRRRFAFVELKPAFESEKFANFLSEAGAPKALLNRIVSNFSALNEDIRNDTTNLGPGFCVGHSFFCDFPKDRTPDDEWYRSVVETEIAPLLREYWFDDPEKAERWIRTLVKS